MTREGRDRGPSSFRPTYDRNTSYALPDNLYLISKFAPKRLQGPTQDRLLRQSPSGSIFKGNDLRNSFERSFLPPFPAACNSRMCEASASTEDALTS